MAKWRARGGRLEFRRGQCDAPLLRGDLGSEVISRGQYGAFEGLPRILRLLDETSVPASFFIPAVSAILNPEVVPSILSHRRHEIGVHGWLHEDLMALNDEAEERSLLTRAIEVLTKQIGHKPVGYRAPSWLMSRYTMAQVKEAGFLYDSSLMAADDPYEITIDGQPSGVIELPIERILDDAPYFSATNGSLPSPELVDQVIPRRVRRGLS